MGGGGWGIRKFANMELPVLVRDVVAKRWLKEPPPPPAKVVEENPSNCSVRMLLGLNSFLQFAKSWLLKKQPVEIPKLRRQSQLPKADPLTFWFSLFGPLVESEDRVVGLFVARNRIPPN